MVGAWYHGRTISSVTCLVDLWYQSPVWSLYTRILVTQVPVVTTKVCESCENSMHVTSALTRVLKVSLPEPVSHTLMVLFRQADTIHRLSGDATTIVTYNGKPVLSFFRIYNELVISTACNICITKTIRYLILQNIGILQSSYQNLNLGSVMGMKWRQTQRRQTPQKRVTS